MQRIDLSKHHIMRDVENKSGLWLPIPFAARFSNKLEVWTLTDERFYKWRGLVPKVTALKETEDIDWELSISMFTLHSDHSAAGTLHDLVFVI